MEVYKFGGASIATPARLKALLPILKDASQPLLIVVSALGKTTNALETIVQCACSGDKDKAHGLALQLEEQHLAYSKELFNGQLPPALTEALNVLYTELQWAIDEANNQKYDYSYDQIVCIGELLSTRIVHAYLSLQWQSCHWADARDLIRTDNHYRDPQVAIACSTKQTLNQLKPLIDAGGIIITQGFIGATDENNSVTLGREGSDYSAALFASMLDATAVTIWKDVEGLLNADPKLFSNTVKIEAITYHEVIEMAYYGAQVIHPKTIKPLQNKQIPLYVKSFLHPEAKGTLITGEVNSLFYPPLIVVKQNQVLLQVTTRDFSFITEDNLSRIYQLFHKLRIKINMLQNAAISFVACIDHNEEKLLQLITDLQADFKIFRNEEVQLLTIRHYTTDALNDLIKSRYVLLEQKTRHTVQVVVK